MTPEKAMSDLRAITDKDTRDRFKQLNRDLLIIAEYRELYNAAHKLSGEPDSAEYKSAFAKFEKFAARNRRILRAWDKANAKRSQWAAASRIGGYQS